MRLNKYLKFVYICASCKTEHCDWPPDTEKCCEEDWEAQGDPA